MMKLRIMILFVLFAIQVVAAKNNFSCPLILNSESEPEPSAQGGVLEFKSETVERYGLSFDNSDSLVLRNYSGMPLKALQFKLLIGKDGGKLNFISITRGSSIPASSFLLDYEIHNGELQPDGSSADVVSVVLLGWGENVLLPGEIHHIISINYDVIDIESDSFLTHLNLFDVVGATSSPVQNAGIVAGEDQTISLKKSFVVENDKLSLLQNYPNPFNPVTAINFTIMNDDYVTLKVFNSIGQEITTLVDEFKTAGNYTVNFGAGNLTSGVYVYQIKSGPYTKLNKMMLIK